MKYLFLALCLFISSNSYAETVESYYISNDMLFITSSKNNFNYFVPRNYMPNDNNPKSYLQYLNCIESVNLYTIVPQLIEGFNNKTITTQTAKQFIDSQLKDQIDACDNLAIKLDLPKLEKTEKAKKIQKPI